MKVTKSKYVKIDALSKITCLIMLAAGIDSLSKGNYFLALLLFGSGGFVGIIPFYIEFQ